MRQTFQITIGMLILMFILSVFFSTPCMLSPRGVSLIATEIQHPSGNELFVRTKLDFAHPETVKDFPQRIGEWHSISYDWSRVEESLGADILLSRAYRHPNFSSPVFFLIIQGKNMSTFHPPVVCYPALGYEIEEVGNTEFFVAKASWAAEAWLSEKEVNIFRGNISAKKLVLVKRTDGEITERRIALYYYVKGERMSMLKEITMIRISALAPLSGSYQDTLEPMKKLASDTFPEMFVVRQKERMVAEMLVIKHGVLGFLVIAILVSAPIIFILFPIIRIRRKR